MNRFFRPAIAAVICAVITAVPDAVEAKRVEPEKAERLAQRFAESRHGTRAGADVRLRHTAKRQGQRPGGGFIRMGTLPQNEQDDAVHYYVFNINEDAGGGFVVVAGDDAIRPVLGYSGNGSYDENNLPPNFAYWMEYLQRQIEYAQEQGIEQNDAMRREWDNYIDGNIFLDASADFVLPLIETKWNQSAPYNNMCPVYSGQRSITGCVATAMAQLMKYYEHPVSGTGSSAPYVTASHGISVPAVNFNVNYDWLNMQNTYLSNSAGTPQNDAVATLMYRAGVSVEMDYSPSSSGAQSSAVPVALTTHFRYDRSIKMNQRVFYGNDEWEDILREQISSGMPIYYSGRNSSSGHAFVLDGYDNAGKFHFNWGWSGMYDGYFVTTALNPGTGGAGAGAGMYNEDQAIIINIKPDEGGVSGGYEMAISDFAASKTIVLHGEPFTVTMDTLRNIAVLDNFPGGRVGVALTDNSGTVVAEVGELNVNFGPASTYNSYYRLNNYTINATVPAAVALGTYKLRIVTSPNVTPRVWKPVMLASNGPSGIDFHVGTADPAQDNADIAAAKTAIEGTAYDTVSMTALNTQAAARLHIISIINGLSLNGVTAAVVNGAFTAATAGTAGNTAGANGSYTFTVTLSKGIGTQQTTAARTLVIAATPYDPTQDNADITAAKAVVEGTRFRVARSILNSQGEARAFVENVLAGLDLNGVTAAVTNIGFQAAVDGADGSFTFTVTLNKGAGAQQVTNVLELVISTTQYYTVTTASELYERIAAYAAAEGNVIVEAGQNLTLNLPVDIPALATAGRTLTVRSADPEAPVTLTRGASGDVFTVSVNAELILEDIAIDGGRDGAFGGGGALIMVSAGGTLAMNGGAILRDNAGSGVHIDGGAFKMVGGEISGNTAGYSGGGAYIDNSGTFKMAGGKISGNTAAKFGGGVDVFDGTFTMEGGTISGNTVANNGGGVYVFDGTFIMTGGEISGNNAGYFGSGAYVREDGTFTMTGGVVTGTGAGVDVVIYVPESTSYHFNNGASAPNNGIVIAWDKPAGKGPFNYIEGENTHLTRNPAIATSAVWAIEDGKFGISYANGANAGFVETAGVTVTANGFSVMSPDRVIPPDGADDVTAVVGAFNAPAGEFTAGPNPVDRSSGPIKIYRQGGCIDNAELTIFDASGNIVSKIRVNDGDCMDGRLLPPDADAQASRTVGAWDLTDRHGRPAARGTYLVRGTVMGINGKKERVSIIVGVR